jgi:hypothetical protein
MLHLPAMLDVMAGVLREGGHKTWVAWLTVVVGVILGFGVRVYRSRR